PYFTTKGNQATGLGLTNVRHIIQQCNGTIEVFSTPGQGTTFQIDLPEFQETADARPLQADPALAEPPRGTETILLVEDEDPVRLLTNHSLQMCGYTVLEASASSEALRICEQHRGPIHLLICDVVMPRMGGRELTRRLIVMRPEMKLLYISGFTDDAMVRHGIQMEAIEFLPKPYTPNALAHKVREVLDK